ncbi:hypothetical protein ASPVEDRAFT_38310 [Aspergillus versicolor CBS 583.65]|uniref:Uncharacterized protein n=1 Tax=Aspergillus versicolor CBS 583.65 TaxID=1036611 RepID=A0A1L9PBA6_ASPVE|nr:uncharacterized protein ASPVEDRAFT_38310 [Aspergillus versicolor CBS 583.65]OJI98809.1 hypothetical protein ASPVEDRAFT_38310 [Aspergillus versicolor CBS 583.65]
MAEVSIQTPFSRDPAQRLRQRPKHRNHNHKYIQKPNLSKPKSSFLDHLFALPGELRLEIHRQILVRPCKYNLRHKDTCDGHAFITSHSYTFRNTQTVLRCANCRPEPWGHCHMHRTSDSPARSQWARPKTNPYFCDDCYPDMQLWFGHERSPVLTGVNCLCARHDGLGWLLANRRIYEEASPLFWKENTFAFERGRVLSEFLEEIPSEKRAMIRSISFRAPVTTFMEIEELGPCWALLQRCTGLRELELDSKFLNWLDSVRPLNGLCIPGVSVRFVQIGPVDNYDVHYRKQVQLRCIWPLASNLDAYSDQLGDTLLASMKGEACDEEYLRRLFFERKRLRTAG